MASQNRREGAKADRAARIKEAAIEIFAEHGYHKAKVSMIVAHVGVAQGTFYLYYKSKREIFGEILGDFLRLLRDAVANWNVGYLETVEDLRAGLISLGFSILHELVSNRDLTRVFLKEALAVHPEFTQQVNTFYEELSDMMTGINRINHTRGMLRKQNFRVLAYCTLGMVERNIQQFIVEPSDPPREEDLRVIIAEIVDLFLYGAVPHGSIPPSAAS